MDVKSLLVMINEGMTLFFVFPIMILFGLYLTIRLRCVQISKLKLSFTSLLKDDGASQGNISHYQAISAVLAGNFGTGNISGMAVAIATGGPGALVWMWVMAFLGAAIQYTSCILGVKYRQQNQDGEYVGGPMYYLRDGLGYKKLAVLFAVLTVVGAITVGNFAQINSITLPLQKMGIDPLVCGLTMAVLVGLVILGGIERVARMASLVVPFKALLYLIAALTILALNAERLLPAIKILFTSAFDYSSAMGGAMGFGMTKAITAGFDRGLFATDAGTGIVPILQASAKTTNPIKDGVVTLVAPFLVMVVCTTTGLVLLVTGAWQQPDLKSTNMVTFAFQQGLGNQIGGYIVLAALALFAYTTILAWACCAEKAIGFLWDTAKAKHFKYLYIALIPIGSLIHVDLIWVLADISISMMLLTNLIGVFKLSSGVINDSRSYFNSQKPAKIPSPYLDVVPTE